MKSVSNSTRLSRESTRKFTPTKINRRLEAILKKTFYYASRPTRASFLELTQSIFHVASVDIADLLCHFALHMNDNDSFVAFFVGAAARTFIASVEFSLLLLADRALVLTKQKKRKRDIVL